MAELTVTPETGLSDSEAGIRLGIYGANALRAPRPVSILSVLLDQLKSPIVYLLLAAAVFALLLDEQVEFIAIILVLAINTAIGFTTEFRALKSMEALRHLSKRSVRVRRSNRTLVLSAEELVPGDIVVLDAGDVVTADMRLVHVSNLSVDESALTGESLPIAKSPEPVAENTILAERTPMLFKGSAIVHGTGDAVVTGTGMNTELGRITRLVDESEAERSPLERQLELLGRHLIWLTLVIAGAVAGVGILSGQDNVLMVKAAVALAVAAIPEGLPIVATLALARGMLRMARHNALIDQLSAVETLGATTVILTDKTGTLTENRMHVDRIVTTAGELTYDRRDGAFLLAGKKVDPATTDDLKALLEAAALCNNAALDESGGPGSGDPMEIALLQVAAAAGMTEDTLSKRGARTQEIAFDAASRKMGVVHSDGTPRIVSVKGAPEAVFDCVTRVMSGTEQVPFDTAQADHWKRICDLLGGQGLRLLAIAGKADTDAASPVYSDLTLYGVVGFQDPPRADIRSAIADAHRAGIDVVMVTGDHATTAEHISQAIGLTPHGSSALAGADLKPLDELDDMERERILATRIFSRVTPEQKLSLITLHQRAGNVVAMTGDGVNDAPALKKADIGVAMGLRGTEVAREAADMVLRDDAFATIIHAIREGRTIFTNIRRFMIYLLSCNLSEVLVVGLAVLAGFPLPLLPLQILFLNLVTDVFPAFALATIRSDRNVLDRPPRPPAESILTSRHWTVIAGNGLIVAGTTLASLLMAILYFEMSGPAVTTMCFYTIALAQLWHVFNMRNWRDGLFLNPVTGNVYVWLAVVLCLAILAIAGLQPEIADALELVPLPADAWGAIALLSLFPLLARQISAAIMRSRRSPQRTRRYGAKA